MQSTKGILNKIWGMKIKPVRVITLDSFFPLLPPHAMEQARSRKMGGALVVHGIVHGVFWNVWEVASGTFILGHSSNLAVKLSLAALSVVLAKIR